MPREKPKHRKHTISNGRPLSRNAELLLIGQIRLCRQFPTPTVRSTSEDQIRAHTHIPCAIRNTIFRSHTYQYPSTRKVKEKQWDLLTHSTSLSFLARKLRLARPSQLELPTFVGAKSEARTKVTTVPSSSVSLWGTSSYPNTLGNRMRHPAQYKTPTNKTPIPTRQYLWLPVPS